MTETCCLMYSLSLSMSMLARTSPISPPILLDSVIVRGVLEDVVLVQERRVCIQSPHNQLKMWFQENTGLTHAGASC